MDTRGLIVLIIGVLCGLLIGWLIWRRRAAKRPGHDQLETRLAATQRRLLASEADRDFVGERVTELQRALRSERSLLDGVASQSGLLPRDFRRILARDYLHTADPYRTSFLEDPVEVEGRLNELTSDDFARRSKTSLLPPVVDASSFTGARTIDLRTDDSAELERQLDQATAERTALETELATVRQSALAGAANLEHTRSAIAELRSQVEALIQNGNPPPVIDLRAGAGTNPDARGLDAARDPGTVPDSDVLDSDVPDPDNRRPVGRAEGARADLANIKRELGEARAALHRVTQVQHRETGLLEEVASLRAQIADRAIERNRLEERLSHQGLLDEQLDGLISELTGLLDRSVALRQSVEARAGGT